MKYRLVCFDVDGTLVDDTVFIWQTIQQHLGTDEKERDKKREEYYAKKITYQEWAEWEIEEWRKKGATKKKIFDAIKKVKLMSGALETIKELKKRGYKLAIISGSLNIVLDYLIPDYRNYFDDVYINHVFFDENGRLKGADWTRYDFEAKADALKEIAKKENLKLSECVFVGDNINDMEIAKEAGFSIAFNCGFEELKKTCDVVIEKKDLREILKYL